MVMAELLFLLHFNCQQLNFDKINIFDRSLWEHLIFKI